MQLTANKSDQQTYISGACSRGIFEKYAGMGKTAEDDKLIVRGIWRMGIEPVAGQSLWIVVMSVTEDIFAELPVLFPEIPGPWKRWGEVAKQEATNG